MSNSNSEAAAIALGEDARSAYIWNRTMFDMRTIGHGSVDMSTYVFRPNAMWDGGVFRNKRYARIWPSIGQFMLAHSLIPASCVECMFVEFGTRDFAPVPTILKSEKWLPRFIEASADFAEQVMKRRELEHERWRSAAILARRSYGAEMRQASLLSAMDHSCQLSPLFRYCILQSINEPSMAAKFEEGALRQYASAKSIYDEKWQDFIPASLSLRAKESR